MRRDAEGRLLGLNALRLEGGLILAVPAGRLLSDRSAALSHDTGSKPVPDRNRRPSGFALPKEGTTCACSD